MAATTASKIENPKITPTIDSMPLTIEDASATQAPPSSGGVGDESKAKSDAVAAKPNKVDEDSAATDVQKKMKRAERFGVAVQLSEQEKRNSRAERFGTAPASNGSDSASKQAEELKRKARAERFGIVPSAPAEEDGKKKARLARFGSSGQTDPVEEDKKKARAIRFSQLGSGSKSSEKENVKVETAIAGKAGGGT